MPSIEWNKIIASVLTALIVAMVAGILANILVRPEHLEKPVFMVATTKAPPSAGKAAAPAGPAPIAPLLAKADPKKGEKVAQVCTTCHTFKHGEPNKIGPNLWNIANGEIAEDRGGFAFSAALQKHKGEKWTPERLNHWLYDPQDFAKGTKMTFAGVKSGQQRADVIAFLETQAPGGEAAWKKLAEEMAKKAKEQKPAAKPEKKAAAKAAPAPSGLPAIGPLLAKADAKKGEQIAQVCAVCHSFKKGEPNKIGPNLWGVFGAKIAESRGGFAFSAALKTHEGEQWTAERLNEWLDHPSHFAKGTKMAFVGIKSAQQRADVIAFLKTLK